MNLLTMVQDVAKNAGIVLPLALSQTDPDCVLLVRFLNEAGAEVERRVDWGALRVETIITGTGARGALPLPQNFSRLSAGMSAAFAGLPIRGSLTPDEWRYLPAVMGDPCYFYLLGGKIAFYPFMRSGDVAEVVYQSSFWASNDVGPQAELVLGADWPLVPPQLLVSGAIWRWRRHVGKDFADYVAEFEAMLNDLARGDGGVHP